MRDRSGNSAILANKGFGNLRFGSSHHMMLILGDGGDRIGGFRGGRGVKGVSDGGRRVIRRWVVGFNWRSGLRLGRRVRWGVGPNIINRPIG